MQDGAHAGLGNQAVGHHLEKIGIQALAVVVRPFDGAAHLGSNALHLDANALALDRALVAVPGQSFHSDGGDHPPKAAKALHQHGIGARPARRQRSRNSGRPGTHHQHVTASQHRQGFTGLLVGLGVGCQFAQSGRVLAQHLTFDGLASLDGHALAGPAGQHALGTGDIFVFIVHGKTSAVGHNKPPAGLGAFSRRSQWAIY